MKIEIQGCFRLGNLDFDFKIRISDFLIKREIQKRISTSRNPFQLRPLNWTPSWKRISVRRNPFLDFAFYWVIRNPKSEIRNRNPDFPIENILQTQIVFSQYYGGHLDKNSLFLPLNGSLSRATMSSKLLCNNNHEKKMSITRSATCFCEKKLHFTHFNFFRSYKSPMVIRILSPTLSAYVWPN